MRRSRNPESWRGDNPYNCQCQPALRAAADHPIATTVRPVALLRMLTSANMDPVLTERITNALEQWEQKTWNRVRAEDSDLDPLRPEGNVMEAARHIASEIRNYCDRHE